MYCSGEYLIKVPRPLCKCHAQNKIGGGISDFQGLSPVRPRPKIPFKSKKMGSIHKSQPEAEKAEFEARVDTYIKDRLRVYRKT
jgi:hypothetical protein